jgi:hypothetical protein
MPSRPHAAPSHRRPPTFTDRQRRQIEAHLREAFRTLRSLPDREWRWLHSGQSSSWPETLREAAEVFANAVEQGGRFEAMKVPQLPPTPAQIDRMLPTLLWLRGAERHEKIAVAMRAMDLPWAQIGRTLGVSPYKAQRAYDRGIESAFVELVCRERTKGAG